MVTHSPPPASGAPVTIVGAGPSGLAAAIVLARAGRKVVVRERRRTVGARFHGDFQGLENWSADDDVLDEINDLGVVVNIARDPVRSGTAYDADGRSYSVSDGRALFYLVRRGSGEGTLDAALLRAALEAGAEISFGDDVDRVPPRTIVATGPRRADVIASGYTFSTQMEDADHVSFDDRLAPWGYAYLLARGGRGTLAVCMFRDFNAHARHLQAAVEYFRERAGLEMIDPKPFGGYGMLSRLTRVERGARLYVGERAGLQDALAGFGLRYAIVSGALAAQSILSGRSYEALLRRRLQKIHRAGIVNRMAFQAAGESARAWVLRRLSRGSARSGLRRLYGGSLLHAALFPIAAMRLGARIHHPACRHIDCDCPWCRMGETGAGAARGNKRAGA